MTKTEIRENFAALVPRSVRDARAYQHRGEVGTGISAQDMRGCVLLRTSGTTGESVPVLRKKQSPRAWAIWRRYALQGVPAFSMIARLVTDIYAEDPRLVPERRESLSMDARPHRRSVHLVNNEEGLRVLAAYAPRAITGYPHHLADLLAVVEATGAAYPGPPFFFTTGEVLSSGVLASAGRLFPGCRNLDVYGLQECGDVAWQCSPGSAYHVNADWLVVEIVKQGRPAGPGEIGEVLVTDLTDLTMPLIRLRTGDLVKVTDRPCHCGIALPVIGRVEGRLADAMSLGEGSAMTPRAVLDRIPAPIRRFRIAQSPHDLRLDVTYEPGCSLERQSVRDRVFQPFSDRGISVRSTCVPESPRQHPKFIPITSGVIRSVDEVTDWHE